METADQESNGVAVDKEHEVKAIRGDSIIPETFKLDEAKKNQRDESADGRIMPPSSAISPARRDLLSSLSPGGQSPVSSAGATSPQITAGSEDRGGAGAENGGSSRVFHEVKGSKSSYGIPVTETPIEAKASNSAMPPSSATTVEQARTQLSWPDKVTNFGDQMTTKLDGIKPRYRRNKKSSNAKNGTPSSSEEEKDKDKRASPHKKSTSPSFTTPTTASNGGELTHFQVGGSSIDPPTGNQRAASTGSPHYYKSDNGQPEQRQTVVEEGVQQPSAAPAAGVPPLDVAARTPPTTAALAHVPPSVKRTPARTGRPFRKESGIRTITKGSTGKSNGNGLRVFVSSDDPRLAP